MKAPTQIQPPVNWQDFEKLCKKLWGEIWHCVDTIKQNGRSGQNQCGVDIYGAPNDGIEYYGIQCKGKDNYIQSQLTEKEIDEEIEKAKNFKPQLKVYYFATTAVKDEKIEQYIRQKNVESQTTGGFGIDIFSWNDIVDLLKERRTTYDWYINNCQYIDSPDVGVYIDWKDEITIHPQYIKTKTTYSLKPKLPAPGFSPYGLDLISPQHLEMMEKISKISNQQQYGISGPPSKKDYRWCNIPINIKNIGGRVLENYKLYLNFEAEATECISDKYSPFNPGGFRDEAAVAQINATKQSEREVFESKEFWNVIEFRPKELCLVQGYSETFKIGIKPKDGVDSIKITWKLLSRDYSKQGELTVKVEPYYQDVDKTIYVDTPEDLKEPLTELTPKIR